MVVVSGGDKHVVAWIASEAGRELLVGVDVRGWHAAANLFWSRTLTMARADAPTGRRRVGYNPCRLFLSGW